MKRKNTLRRLFNIQGGLCAYCEIPMDINTCNKPNSPTVDHIIPKSKGGTCDPFNLVCACRACNNAKGDLPLVVFIGLKRKVMIS
jgi:5-methylcytosine-specific restriction endonuclease McrA